MSHHRPAWEEEWPSRLPDRPYGPRYPVAVYVGKDADLVALKWRGLIAFTDSASRHRALRERMLQTMKFQHVSTCPICGSPASESRAIMEVYGLRYQLCPSCIHGFVATPPSHDDSMAFYASDAAYSATYTDREIHLLRLREIYGPKAVWLADEYRRLCGRTPRRVLDVGAGAGHFVAACRQLGIHAEGVEPNEDNVEFCRQTFGVQLSHGSFLGADQRFEDFDVVTFWGVIEHHPDPLEFLNAARRALAGENPLVLVEVPHLSSFGTAVQMLFPTSIIRHCDPFSHLHLFSDQSISLAFEKCGFIPVTAWYFGMDAFEMVSQLAFALSSDHVFSTLGAKIPVMQNAIDRNKLSDSLIVLGKPVAR